MNPMISSNTSPERCTRALLLSKQLYIHALDHSRLSGALDKMIAVHNFHNAIEVTLRTIMLENEIRLERELNVDFETLINGVDQFPPFLERKLRLPYRVELRRLNSVRNLVQHQAHEPELATMEEWRVFSVRFLTRAFKQYFQIDFDSLSALMLIRDVRLRQLLQLSSAYQVQLSWSESMLATKLAFKFASHAIGKQLPTGDSNWPFSTGTTREIRSLGLEPFVRALNDRIADVEQFATFLAVGGAPTDYVKFSRSPGYVHLTNAGPYFSQSAAPITEEDAAWVHQFVVNTIVRWQTAGLDAAVPQGLQDTCDEFIEQKRQLGSGGVTYSGSDR